MAMRYRGGGIGHKSTREATHCLNEDRDVLDRVRDSCEDIHNDEPEPEDRPDHKHGDCDSNSSGGDIGDDDDDDSGGDVGDDDSRGDVGDDDSGGDVGDDDSDSSRGGGGGGGEDLLDEYDEEGFAEL
jgi:hypothetical protein